MGRHDVTREINKVITQCEADVDASPTGRFWQPHEAFQCVACRHSRLAAWPRGAAAGSNAGS